jgi:hypothetical protein
VFCNVGQLAVLSMVLKSFAKPELTAYALSGCGTAGLQLEPEVPQTQVGGQPLSIESRVVELRTVQLLAKES